MEAQTRLEALRERMSRQARPSDRWPLFEVRVSLLDEHRTRVHVSVDAIIMDLWSSRLWAGELLALYQDPSLSLPPLEFSFRDYVLADQAERGSEAWERDRQYWLRRLDTLPPAPDLPLVRDPPPGAPRFRRHRTMLASPEWGEVKRRAGEHGLTPSVVLLTAYAEVLAVWSRIPHFMLNVTQLNRRPVHPQVGQLIGNFSALTLLEVETDSQVGFVEQARRLQRQLWADLERARFSGVQVMREFVRRGGASVSAVMPIVFTSALGMPAATGGLQQELPPVVHGITQGSQVYLNHGVSEVDGALEIRWDALEERFPPGVIEAMFEAFTRRMAPPGRRVMRAGAWQGWPPWSRPRIWLVLRRSSSRPSSPSRPLATQSRSRSPPHGAPSDMGSSSAEPGRSAGACARREYGPTTWSPWSWRRGGSRSSPSSPSSRPGPRTCPSIRPCRRCGSSTCSATARSGPSSPSRGSPGAASGQETSPCGPSSRSPPPPPSRSRPSRRPRTSPMSSTPPALRASPKA